MFCLGHGEIVDAHFGMAHRHFTLESRLVVLAHHRDIAHDLVTGVGKVDEERRELAMSRCVGIGLGHHQGHLRDAGT